MKTWNGMSYEQAHRLLWNTIASSSKETKDDNYELVKLKAFKKINKNHEPLPRNNCFACDIVHKRGGGCFSCPIFDPNKKNDRCLNGLFRLWINAKGKKKAKYARKIANLPWIVKEK